MKKSPNSSWMCVLQQLAGGLIVLCVLVGAGYAADHVHLDPLALEQLRLINLTHSFGADTIAWPTEQNFRLVLQ